MLQKLIALGAFIIQVPIASLDMLFQHSHTFWVIVAASLPLAFIGTCGIFILEFPDHDADLAVKKRNLMSVFGKTPGVYIFIMLCLLSYTTLFMGIALGMIPPSGAIMLITVPLMALATWGLVKYNGGARGIVMPIVYVVAACVVTGLLLILSYL